MKDDGRHSVLRNQIAQMQEGDFEELALEVLRFQYAHCSIYRTFVDLLGVDVQQVEEVAAIPYLPIAAFKEHDIQSGSWSPETQFLSSGTTGMVRSRHLVRSIEAYHRGTIATFEHFFGSLRAFEVLAVLPHYLRAGQSSLVSMAQAFMSASGQSETHFYLDDFDRLAREIDRLQGGKRRLLILGVSYALLDFAHAHPMDLSADTLVIETGGMKGRHRDIAREELHAVLRAQLGVPTIHSEYGMTEMSSQAYTDPSGRFHTPPCLRILVREMTDPLVLAAPGKTGIVHVADLANLDTCAFVATEDLGRLHEEGGFEILGRLQHADLRGCHLMYEC